jgi:hypothetical protein
LQSITTAITTTAIAATATLLEASLVVVAATCISFAAGSVQNCEHVGVLSFFV